MIASIVVTGRHNIGVNSGKKIKVNDNILSLEKDIPFIRYRFDDYSNEDFEYIKSMMSKFSYSTHLVEIKLSDKSAEILEYFEDNIPNIAKYIYIDVTDEIALAKSFGEDLLNLLDSTLDYTVDRYVLKDKSTCLDTVSAKSIIRQCCKQLSLTEEMFGVCSSPLSFGDWACLTAVKARELMSSYSTIADVALPTANHQCMNCCGCIRYFVVESDLEAPADAKPKGASKKEKTQVVKEKKETVTKAKPKNTIVFNRCRL